MLRLADRWQTFVRVYQKEIWQPGQLKRLSPRACLYATLRVVSITWTVFTETKAASRAAALSFSSLLGLGPLVAITVLIAGFTLDKNDPSGAANALGRLINFVAPQLGVYPAPASEKTAPDGAGKESQAHPAPPQKNIPPPPEFKAVPTGSGLGLEPLPVNPRIVELLNNFIAGARSSSAGAFGMLSLVLIVLLLFKTVEDTFNEIWGVRSGR